MVMAISCKPSSSSFVCFSAHVFLFCHQKFVQVQVPKFPVSSILQNNKHDLHPQIGVGAQIKTKPLLVFDVVPATCILVKGFMAAPTTTPGGRKYAHFRPIFAAHIPSIAHERNGVAGATRGIGTHSPPLHPGHIRVGKKQSTPTPNAQRVHRWAAAPWAHGICSISPYPRALRTSDSTVSTPRDASACTAAAGTGGAPSPNVFNWLRYCDE